LLHANTSWLLRRHVISAFSSSSVTPSLRWPICHEHLRKDAPFLCVRVVAFSCFHLVKVSFSFRALRSLLLLLSLMGLAI
jgi:hypothetical protein